MKRKLFILLAALAVVAACQSKEDTKIDNPEDLGPQLIPMTFKGEAEEFGTKSDIIVDDNTIIWEAGDAIAVYDGTALREFTATAVSGTGRGAEFSGSAASADNYYAVVPKSAASYAGGYIKARINGSQTVIGDHHVDDGALITIAKADNDNTFNFENQFALVKVNIDRSDVVSILFKGNNNEIINGLKTWVDLDDTVLAGNPEGVQVRLTYKATAESEPSAFPRGDYYIAIWPQSFPNGYKFFLTLSDGSKAIKSTSASYTLERNAGQNMSTIDDVTTWVGGTITTAAQLKMWRRIAETYVEGEEVKLGADINLGGYSWTPVPEFLGIFNGQGHKIYNFTISSTEKYVGFIGTLGSSNAEEAVLKNVVFGSSNGTSYDGSSSITITGARSGWTYGGVVGYAQKKSTVSGVTNYMPVTAAASVTGKHGIGGIVGVGDGGSGNGITINGCHNYGAVTDNSASETTENSAIGGILGSTDGSYTTVSSCVNHAEIHNYCVAVSRLGGIVGKAWDANITISECSNAGNITNEAASVTDANGNWDNAVGVGGILGAFTSSKAGAVINKCSNSGTVKMAASPNKSYHNTYGGIVGNITYGCTVKGCTNTGNYTETVDCESLLAVGGIVGLANSSNFILTKADDDTYNTNSGELWHRKAHVESFYGGIVGLANSFNYIEYCINNGRLVSDPNGQGTATIHMGGICGAATKIIRNCTNNGYIFAWAKSLIAYMGGICGGTKTPTQVLDCVNNGYMSPYNSSGKCRCGGVLAYFEPSATTVRRCTNTGMITTGDFYRNGSGNSPGTLRNFYGKDYYMGGLFGEVMAPTANVTDNVTDCIVACTFGQMTGSESMDNYKGIIAGQTKSKSSTAYQLVFGTASNPIMIVNTTKFQYGTNANPAVITQGDVITTTVLANKWLMGSSSSLYDAANGSSDTSKIDFNYVIATPAGAGIE